MIGLIFFNSGNDPWLFLRMQKKVLVLFFFLLGFACLLSAQKIDSTKSISHFSGAVSATNNGISLIPTFSLGKPAAIFNMSLGKSKFSFEPELAFSLEGKPWYSLFWFRYKLANTNKFKMTAGTHLGLNFKDAILPVDMDSTEVKVVDRYLAGELAPSYSITKNISAGIYYLYARGLDPGANRMTNFVTLNASFSNIKLIDKFFMRAIPQFYYLNMDAGDGFYFTSAFTLARRNFPLSISSIMNKAIQTDIPAGKDFVWNVILTYSFGKRYVAL
jgi:hypothetical protein